MNHHNAYIGKYLTTTPSESSFMGHYMVTWTSEEDEFLVEGLACYSSDTVFSRYVKIASWLPNKTVRDVAIRCRWIYNENAKRRKEDYNGLGRARVHDNKEIIDKVVASQVFERYEHRITNELLRQNVQWFSQISANFTSLTIMDNVDLFNKIWKNINTIVDNFDENVSETMKHMPALPEKLNEELFMKSFSESELP